MNHFSQQPNMSHISQCKPLGRLVRCALEHALASIPVAFALTTVAARVVGETSVAPIGALGKVSQLTFGVMAPAIPSPIS